MTTSAKLDQITDFPSLIDYLRDELDWEIPEDAAFNDLTFSWTPSEVGLELNEPIEITQLRPLRADQPWGIFFLNFPQGKLPVTVMRRILRGLSKRQRASANAGDKAAWNKDDLLFISAVGEADDRRLSFAHFQDRGNDLPALRVIGWDQDDTVRRLSHVDQLLHDKLAWPDRGILPEAWRDQWRSAFTERPRESVRTAKAMAEALAALARDIRDRIKLILPKEKADGDLRKLFEAVKQTLSKDLDAEKFADTYAQTIAYGLLSARINQVRERDAKHEEAQKVQLGPKPELPQITADAAGKAMPTTNPFLRELFGSFLSAGGRDGEGSGLDFDELGVGEVVDLLNAADMEAVLLDFDKHKAGDDPVIHFYEGFLHAYDKALKVQRGVFYTPRPVVSFIVRSVDEVLRTEFGLEDGLADITTWADFVASHPEVKIPDGVKGDESFVKILDPATGTGTFLVEVIELIHDRLVAKWTKAGLDAKARLEAWNAWVPQHLLPRLYGFELMMAPYAVAHMKIGLKLADTGYRFEGLDAEGKPARARVFLTNALEPARDLSMELTFMSLAMAHEAKAANDAKAKARFTVVTGNPPYNSDSKNHGPWIMAEIEAYKRTVRERETQIQALSDDYVKFFRIAEVAVRASGVGVIGYITGDNYTTAATFRDMRAELLKTFEHSGVVALFGNLRTRAAADTDENVFDIKTGVSIFLGRRLASAPTAAVSWSGVRGDREAKLATLERHTLSNLPETQTLLIDTHDSYLAPRGTSAPEYAGYLSAPEAFGTGDYAGDKTIRYGSGFKTQQDEFAITFTRPEIVANVTYLLNTETTEAALRTKFTMCGSDQWRFERARARLSDTDWQAQIIECLYRPFDVRFSVLNADVISNPRREIMGQYGRKNVGLCLGRQGQVISGPWSIVHCTSRPQDQNLFYRGGNTNFPLWIGGNGAEREHPNLSPAFASRLAKVTSLTFDDGSDAPAQTTLGAAFDPTPPAQSALPLRRERGDLKTTFGPRDVFDWIYVVLHSPAYRERYADFLKSDFARIPLPKDRALFADLIPLGTELVALHLLDAAAAPILAEPKVRFVNPGNVEARIDGRKIATRRNAAGRVYVNEGCWFETVPESVWTHWIGGYQPAQKWLKDRAQTGSGAKLKPGRVLTPEDQLHYRRMIVALVRTAELMTEIDQVIAKHGGWPDAFKGMTD